MSKEKIQERIAIIFVIALCILGIGGLFYQIVVDIGFEKGVKYSAGEFLWESHFLCRDVMNDFYADSEIEFYDTGFNDLIIINCVSGNRTKEIMTLNLEYD